MAQISARLPNTISLTALVGLFGIQLTAILTAPVPSHPIPLAGSVASSAAVFALQVRNSSSDVEFWSVRRRLAMLMAQGAATYLPLLAFGMVWAGMTGFLAGSVLLLLPGRKAWVLFTAIAMTTLAAAVVLGLGAHSVALLAVAGPATGLVVSGISRLALLVGQAHATHTELAQLTLVRERERFARDLHDLLGYSLSAIALKAELSRRIAETDPGTAREELAEVVSITRQAVADVRLVANGYRNMSLIEEASSAASLLSEAGIVTDVKIDCGAFDDKVDTVLATVLREGVTNVLRHSTARHCSITVSQSDGTVTLALTNDGVPRSTATHRERGGLENLTVRLETVGGTLTAAPAHDGTFRLLAKVADPGRTALYTRRPPPDANSRPAC